MHQVNGAQGMARSGVAFLALEVLCAEDVDIEAQWSVMAKMEKSKRSGRATQAEYSKGASRHRCVKVGGVN